MNDSYELGHILLWFLIKLYITPAAVYCIRLYAWFKYLKLFLYYNYLMAYM